MGQALIRVSHKRKRFNKPDNLAPFTNKQIKLIYETSYYCRTLCH